MISITCSCGGDFWVRDRVAGQSTQCPTCGKKLGIPPMEVIEARMTPSRCGCGEVFWSATWRPGRRTKCPICGRAVGGPAPTTAATVSSSTQSTGGSVAAPVAPKPAATGRPKAGPAASPVSALQDRLRSRWPALVGSLAVVAVLGVFSLMLWSGGTPAEPGGGGPPPVEANPGTTPPVEANPGATPPVGTTGLTGNSSGTGQVETPPVEPKPALPPVASLGPAESPDLPEPFRSARLRLLVPAYFYPGGPGLESWEQLIDSAGRAPIAAIVNPNSGPGDQANPDYAAVIRRAEAAGLLTVGYVSTNYAERSSAEVKEDIDRWVRFYPEIGGIFLDAQSSSGDHAGYYAELCDYVRSRIEAPLVVSNPGVLCSPAYFARPTADVIVVFENSRGFESFRIPSTHAGYKPLRFAALPYAIADSNEMQERLHEAALKGIGCLYVTDGGQADAHGFADQPWGRLPTYWDEEVDAVARINQQPAK